MTALASTPAEELAVMCGLVRAVLGTDTRERYGWRAQAGRIAPARFEALVRRHRLGVFLSKRLPSDIMAALPKESTTVLAAVAAEGSLAALGRAGELVRLIRACASAGLPVLGVKGVVLAQELYGNAAHRHSGDIDLVFHPGQVEAADAVLRACGYRRTRPGFELTPRQHREYLKLKPEFEYWSKAARIRVELHWRLEGLGEQEVWSDPVRCRLGGCEIGTLTDALNMRYLCEHGARHGWFRLFWLVDVALLMAENREAWPDVRVAARREGTERALAQAAQLATELLGAPLRSEWAAETEAERRVVKRLVIEARRQMEAPEDAARRTGEWVRQLRYRVALQRRWTTKWQTVKPHFYSPLGWSMLHLPDRWFWLYPPLTPFLWLWRRLAPKRRA